MKRGRVIKSTGSWYKVRLEDGSLVDARVRGKFRNSQVRSTNPVAVGDWVMLSGEDADSVITEIEDRENYIVRKSVNLSRQSHIIASNLSQAVLVATFRNPTTFPAFIDRFCVAAEAFHIPVSLVFNKIDLLDKDELSILKSFQGVYEDLGYKTIACSAVSGAGMDDLRALLKGNDSLLSGHSGVGKSSLINMLDANLDLRVGAISEAHFTGQHTTTFAEMHPLHFGGNIVDTPGIRGFGMVEVEPAELAGYFPEMRELLPDCKYYNCLHINEPGCAVKSGLKNGTVAETRYNSYLNMYENRDDDTYRK